MPATLTESAVAAARDNLEITLNLLRMSLRNDDEIGGGRSLTDLHNLAGRLARLDTGEEVTIEEFCGPWDLETRDDPDFVFAVRSRDWFMFVPYCDLEIL